MINVVAFRKHNFIFFQNSQLFDYICAFNKIDGSFR